MALIFGGIKLDISILQSHFNRTDSGLSQSQAWLKSDISFLENKQKDLETIIVKHQEEVVCMLKEENLIEKEKLLTLENISSLQEEEICMLKEQNHH